MLPQDKPFLHIDNDTFLFESRLVGNSYPITFSFPDINQPLNMKRKCTNKTYFDTYTKIKHLFDEEFFIEQDLMLFQMYLWRT